MDWTMITLDTIMPGWVFLLAILIVHFLTSTAAHIKMKDFQIAMWPEFLNKVTQFGISLLMINLGVLLSKSISSGTQLQGLIEGLRAGLYGLYFGYYADNVFKHLNLMGLPIDPGLLEFFKSLFGKVTGIGTLVSDQDIAINDSNDEGGRPV